jgi:hypothetical protein
MPGKHDRASTHAAAMSSSIVDIRSHPSRDRPQCREDNAMPRPRIAAGELECRAAPE